MNSCEPIGTHGKPNDFSIINKHRQDFARTLFEFSWLHDSATESMKINKQCNSFDFLWILFPRDLWMQMNPSDVIGFLKKSHLNTNGFLNSY